jgi:hypothetical protein
VCLLLKVKELSNHLWPSSLLNYECWTCRNGEEIRGISLCKIKSSNPIIRYWFQSYLILNNKFSEDNEVNSKTLNIYNNHPSQINYALKMIKKQQIWTMARSYKCRQRVNVRMVADLVSCSSFFSSYVGGETHYHLSRDISHFLGVVVVTTLDFWISLHTFVLFPPLYFSLSIFLHFLLLFFLKILLPFPTVHPTLPFLSPYLHSPCINLSLYLFFNIIPLFICCLEGGKTLCLFWSLFPYLIFISLANFFCFLYFDFFNIFFVFKIPQHENNKKNGRKLAELYYFFL